jgi:hypothetical protein
MLKRPLNRGTSILAALVFVAILSAVGYGVHLLAPSATSQTAAAASPTVTKTPVEQACDEAKQKAALNQGQDATDQSSSATDAAQDNCVAAVVDPSKPNEPANSVNKYMCVGKSAVVDVTASTGAVAVKSTANTSQPKGVCKTVACQPDPSHPGQKDCMNANLAGISKAKITDYLSGNTDTQKFSMTDDRFNDIYGSPNTALDSRATAGIDDVFKNQKAQDDVQSLQGQINDVGQEIHAYTEACSGANLSTCDTTDLQRLDALKAEQADLQAKQDALKSEITDISASKKSLSPDENPNPSTDCETLKTCPGDTRQNPPANCETLKNCPEDGRKDTFPQPKGSVTPPPAQQQQTPPSQQGGGSNSGFNQFLQSMLQSLAKGLGQAATQQQGAPCSSDPNAYAQQQQQYNMQLQQYNYQLQQYNYQQQLSQLNGLQPPPPPIAPAACSPTSQSNTCAAQPAQPTSQCNGQWRPITTQQSNGAACTTGWQCVPSTATPPTADLSCQPLVADVGMSIAIAYSCGNATDATSQGFLTGGALSGSTSTVITTPPPNANSATFGITCRNQNLTANAQCSVQIGRASIILVANPKVVEEGEGTTIGWITSGMQSCVISSPDLGDFTAENADNTSVNGMASTSPLTSDARFLLHCLTVGGNTRDATTTVEVMATSTNQ